MTEPVRDLERASVEVLLSGQTASGAYLASPSFPTYRYCWFRDGAFIAHAMSVAGDQQNAGRFHEWAIGVVLGEADKVERAIDRSHAGLTLRGEDVIHTRYTSDGRTADGDWPNFQLDGLGTWLWSLGHWTLRNGVPSRDAARAVDLVARYLAALWTLPSYDCWEESGDQVHVSTLAAIYGGLEAAAHMTSEPGLADTARQIREFVLSNGVVGGRLRKHLGTAAVDASLIWAATPFRLLDPDDPVMVRTVSAIEQSLTGPGGWLRRYLGDTYYGGGEWPLLTAQLGWYWTQRGGPAEAQRSLHQVQLAADSSGELPEQVLDGAQEPEQIDEWVERWGPVAKPLLWSHAAYLILLHALRDIAD